LIVLPRMHLCYYILCLILMTSSAQLYAEQLIRFGTGGSAGSYFPVGSAIAKEINQRSVACCSDNPLLVIPQRSNGSVSNIRDLGDNLLEIALAQADVVSLAYQGMGQFEGVELKSVLRTIGTLYQESVHLVVAVDSNINSIADLTGKRVAVDELGSGTQFDAELILAASGMSSADVKPIYLKPADSIKRMRSGLVDAIFIVSAYPVVAVQKLIEDGVGQVVSLGNDLISDLANEHLYFSAQSIPPDIYAGDEEINTLSVSAQMIVRADLPTAAAYEITSTLWSDTTLRALLNSHPRGSDLVAGNALQGVGIPLHPGALRYYKEQNYDLSGVPR